MTVQCVSCMRMDMRIAGRMAANGFACCAMRPAHEFHPVLMDRECAHHQPAPGAQVQARLAWIEKRKGGSGCDT